MHKAKGYGPYLVIVCSLLPYSIHIPKAEISVHPQMYLKKPGLTPESSQSHIVMNNQSPLTVSHKVT
jgi:hypothetical protein